MSEKLSESLLLYLLAVITCLSFQNLAIAPDFTGVSSQHDSDWDAVDVPVPHCSSCR